MPESKSERTLTIWDPVFDRLFEIARYTTRTESRERLLEVSDILSLAGFPREGEALARALQEGLEPNCRTGTDAGQYEWFSPHHNFGSKLCVIEQSAYFELGSRGRQLYCGYGVYPSYGAAFRGLADAAAKVGWTPRVRA